MANQKQGSRVVAFTLHDFVGPLVGEFRRHYRTPALLHRSGAQLANVQTIDYLTADGIDGRLLTLERVG